MGREISIAIETNGKGYLGFISELPGAFIRGKTLGEALSKAEYEAIIYQKWSGKKDILEYNAKVVQMHESNLMVEDADTEILLNVDKGKMEDFQFENYIKLARKSCLSALNMYSATKHKNWIDEERIRKTFYGDVPKSVQEIFDHIDSVQYYYLSRICSNIKEITGFLERREYCLKRISKKFSNENNYNIYNIDNELWTIKKVLRRFIWHDRIHAKSIIKILKKQKDYGLIDDYYDPFFFEG